MQRNVKLRHLVLFAVVLVVWCSVAQAQGLDRGHRVLLERGLQLHAWAYPGSGPGITGWDFGRWAESNFTGIGLSGGGYGDELGAAGIPWTRIMYHGRSYPNPLTAADIEPHERPYASLLVSLDVGHENKKLMDPVELANLATIYATLRSRYPDVLMHSVQSGRQYDIDELRTFMQATQPDMLMFDDYPFTPANKSGIGIPGFVFQAMETYRLLGLEGNDGTGNHPIPVAQFTQTYVPSYAASESQIRLNVFSSWAFGYKLVHSFIYDGNWERKEVDGEWVNHGVGPLLFDGPGTDNPTPQFCYVAETNRQSLNLGPALVRLISTDTHVILKGGPAGPPPSDPSGEDRLFFWDSSADPYITAIKATNPGSINGGNPGDVTVGYFEPLDASFTNPGHKHDIHFRIVNGLSDRNGSAAECAQQIHLEFDFGDSGITSLERLSRDTGLVEPVSLVSDGGSLYHLDLVLDGGVGDLFKFNNGGTFVSGPYVPPHAQPNLVYNGDMEIGGADSTTPPSGWSPNGGATAGSSTDVPPNGGSQSAAFERTGGGTATLSQTISGLTPETDYVFNFWFKGTLLNVSMWGSGNQFAGGPVFWEWYYDPQYPSPEKEWTHATHSDYGWAPWVITTPAGCTEIKLIFSFGFAGGTPILLDNVSLSPLLPVDGDLTGAARGNPGAD